MPTYQKDHACDPAPVPESISREPYFVFRFFFFLATFKVLAGIGLPSLLLAAGGVYTCSLLCGMWMLLRAMGGRERVGVEVIYRLTPLARRIYLPRLLAVLLFLVASGMLVGGPAVLNKMWPPAAHPWMTPVFFLLFAAVAGCSLRLSYLSCHRPGLLLRIVSRYVWAELAATAVAIAGELCLRSGFPQLYLLFFLTLAVRAILQSMNLAYNLPEYREGILPQQALLPVLAQVLRTVSPEMLIVKAAARCEKEGFNLQLTLQASPAMAGGKGQEAVRQLERVIKDRFNEVHVVQPRLYFGEMPLWKGSRLRPFTFRSDRIGRPRVKA